MSCLYFICHHVIVGSSCPWRTLPPNNQNLFSIYQLLEFSRHDLTLYKAMLISFDRPWVNVRIRLCNCENLGNAIYSDSYSLKWFSVNLQKKQLKRIFPILKGRTPNSRKCCSMTSNPLKQKWCNLTLITPNRTIIPILLYMRPMWYFRRCCCWCGNSLHKHLPFSIFIHSKRHLFPLSFFQFSIH